jgi:hypothetical protein
LLLFFFKERGAFFPVRFHPIALRCLTLISQRHNLRTITLSQQITGVDMTYVSTEVGDVIFVWRKRFSAINPFGKNKSAIISAHGNDARINSKFPNERAYSLHYYGPHGHSLVDPGLEMFLNKTAKVTETVSSTNAQQDYVLSKYQNKHNKKGESYTKGFLENTFNIEDDFEMDIITLRSAKKHNNGRRLILLLSDVIDILFKAGFEYEHFHCSFCRGGGQAVEIEQDFPIWDEEAIVGSVINNPPRL